MFRGFPFAAMSLAFLLLAPTLRAGEKEEIQKAIDRGVDYLKQAQQADGQWSSTHKELGSTALAALALVESGVAVDDPAIQKAAALTREASIPLTHTYSLALAIMLLDRLGDPNDVFLIQSMGVRLLAGQNEGGGWSYQCPSISDVEARRLILLLRQRNQLIAKGGVPDKPTRKPTGKPSEESTELPKEIRQQLAQIRNVRAGGRGAFKVPNGAGDNSNTQFAILGLWVAHRHGIPVENALAHVETRFRNSQNADGGWGYVPGARSDPSNSTPAMTCAGLLGLAMAYGAANEAILRTDPKEEKAPRDKKPKEPLDPSKDPAIRAGLLALGTSIDHPGKKRGALVANNNRITRGYYFLWSVERVGVAFNLETIGTKDWYAWGSELLLASQQADGRWQGEYGGEVDTSFALLFLRRSNLTLDLTTTLKGKIKDPGEVTLKSGGVGGEALLNRNKLKPGIEFNDKSGEPPARNPKAESPSATTGNSKPDEKPKTPDPRKVPLPPLPVPEGQDNDAARLAGELVKAPAAQQEKLLIQFRDGQGASFTTAMALAIPQLEANLKIKARDALMNRLSRMTAATLRDKLQEENVEVRRAAALACSTKDDKNHIPDLIPLLEDPDVAVARTAKVALTRLSGRDFGPSATASAAERAKAVTEWKLWWKSQVKK